MIIKMLSFEKSCAVPKLRTYNPTRRCWFYRGSDNYGIEAWGLLQYTKVPFVCSTTAPVQTENFP